MMATLEEKLTQNVSSPIILEVDAWIKEINQRHLNDKLGFPNFGVILAEFRQFCLDYFANSAPEDSNTVNTLLFEYWEPLRYALMQHRVESYRGVLAKGYGELDFSYVRLSAKLNLEISLEQKSRTVIYFEKTAKAKRYPFRGVNLIGVPLDDGRRDKWMSIPHEIGHLLYWNARFSRQDRLPQPRPGQSFFENEIDESIRGLESDDAKSTVRQLLMDWSEEIFADIVGAQIAGKEFADSALNRVFARNKTADELFVNDGEHPLPWITPYISHLVAAQPGEEFDIRHWERYEIDQARLNTVGGNNSVSAAQLLACTMVFVKGINEKLQTIRMDTWKPAETASSFTMLRDFVQSNFPNTSSDVLRAALLKPKILDRAEAWYCFHCHSDKTPAEKFFCNHCGWPRIPFFS